MGKERISVPLPLYLHEQKVNHQLQPLLLEICAKDSALKLWLPLGSLPTRYWVFTRYHCPPEEFESIVLSFVNVLCISFFFHSFSLEVLCSCGCCYPTQYLCEIKKAPDQNLRETHGQILPFQGMSAVTSSSEVCELDFSLAHYRRIDSLQISWI